MKRVKEQIKYLALLAICLLSGCSDFLDSYNPSAVTDDFYNTKEGQKKLLTDINARYRNVFNTGELQYYGTDIYMAISEEPANTFILHQMRLPSVHYKEPHTVGIYS